MRPVLLASMVKVGLRYLSTRLDFDQFDTVHGWTLTYTMYNTYIYIYYKYIIFKRTVEFSQLKMLSLNLKGRKREQKGEEGKEIKIKRDIHIESA